MRSAIEPLPMLSQELADVASKRFIKENVEELQNENKVPSRPASALPPPAFVRPRPFHSTAPSPRHLLACSGSRYEVLKGSTVRPTLSSGVCRTSSIGLPSLPPSSSP